MQLFIVISIFNSFLSLLSTFLVVSYFGFSVYGELSFVLAFVGVLCVLLNKQTWQIVYDNQTDFEAAGKLAIKKDLVSNIMGLIVALLICLLSLFENNFHFALASILLIFNSYSSLTSLLRLRGHHFLASGYRTPFLCLRVLALTFMTYEKNAINLALFIVLPELISFLLLILFTFVTRGVYKKNDLKEFKLNSGAYKSALIDLPVNYLDVLILGSFVSAENLGLFRFGKTIIQSLGLIVKPFLDWFTPIITRNPSESQLKIYGLFSACSILLFIVLSFMPEMLVHFNLATEEIIKILEVPTFKILLSVMLAILPLGILKARMYGFGFASQDVWLLLIANLAYLIMLGMFASDDYIWLLFWLFVFQSIFLTFLRVGYLNYAIQD